MAMSASTERELIETLMGLRRTMDAMAQVNGLRTSGGIRPGDVDPSRGRGGSSMSPDERKEANEAAKRSKRIEHYDAMLKKWMESAKHIYSPEHAKIFKELSDSWEANSNEFKELSENVQLFRQGIGKLGAQAKRLVDGMGRFEDKLAKSTKAQSLLYAEQLRNINSFRDFEYSAYINKLTEAADSLENGTAKALKLIDEATGQMRKDLNVEDFTRVMRTIGEFDATVKEALAKAKFGSIDEMVNSGALGNSATRAGGPLNQAEDAIINLAHIAEMQGWGLDRDKFNLRNSDGSIMSHEEIAKANIDLRALAEELKRLTGGFDTANKRITKVVTDFTVPWVRLAKSLRDEEGKKAAMGALSDWARSLSASALMMKAWRKAGEAYNQTYEFNTAQVNQSLVQTIADSIKMGTSFADTTKILQENKRMLAIYGPGQFKTAFGGMQDTFQKFGYTLKQSAELIAPTIESAVAAGINVRDSGALTKFTDNMMNAFQSISGVVNISAKEFMEMNTQLFKADGAFESLVGMDKDRRQAYAADLVQLRSRYILGGLEKDQAQQLVQLQQQQAREAVKSKLSAGGKLMNAAMFAGMSPDQALRLMTLRNKGMRTTDEDAELAALQGNLGQMLEQRRTAEGSANNGFTWFSDVFRDSNALESSDQQAMKLGMTANMAKEAGFANSKGEADRAGAAAKGNESFAWFATQIDRVSNLLNSAFLGAIGSATMGLVAFTYQLSKAGISLSDLIGGPGKIPGGPAGAAGAAGKWGKIGSALGTVGKYAGYAGLAINAGTAAYSAYDAGNQYDNGQITESQRNAARGSAVGNLAGSLGGAMLGRMLGGVVGSALGPVGTIGGALLGGWLGGMAGDWVGGKLGGMTGSDTLKGGSKIIPAEGINTPAQEGINQQTLNVVDKATVEQLIALNTTMTKAAETLERLAQAQGANTAAGTNTPAMPDLPTQQKFVARTSS